MKNMPVTDVTIINHGSITLVRPETDAAREWIRDNVQDGAQYLGRSLAVEPRYLDNLIAGMQGAGLEVS